jgi:uncharacterized spore protein YtfJ
MTDKENENELTSVDLASAVVDETMSKFLEAADVRKVYGRATKHGDITIIPAAEVLVAMGFAIGAGTGPGAGTSSGTDETQKSEGTGGGGGGGGRTLARPVAIVIASPDGVRVEPVIDPTKIVMAALTAGGFVGGMMFRMMRKRSRKRG